MKDLFKYNTIKGIGVGAFLLTSLSSGNRYCNIKEPSAESPNLIFILVDDLGWKDVGYMGSKYFETPNIDKLAGQSMVFTNAYAACAVCSPTRASIMTGRYPARLGLTDFIHGISKSGRLISPPLYVEIDGKSLKTPSNPFWMELSEVTIAEVLKKSGYFCCHIGKWHLGLEEYYPGKHGFDLNIAGCELGQPPNYFDPYLNKNGSGFPNLVPRKEGEYLTDRLADELKSVIVNHRDKPFFINMCHYAVHTPLMGKQDLVNKYKSKKTDDGQKNPVYVAMVESMDQAVGKLVATLKENLLLEKTVIVFMSDNGGLIGSMPVTRPVSFTTLLTTSGKQIIFTPKNLT